MDTPIFYTALFVHLVSLITGFGAVIVIDTFGLLWLLKKIDLKQVTRVAEVTQRLIWIGWGGLVLSGIPMILIKGYVDNLTQIKLFSVFMLGLNGIFLHLVKKSLEKVNDNVPSIIKFKVGMTTVISQIGWWSALSIGFVHRHWRHNISWPSNPWTIVFIYVIILIVVYVVGVRLLRNKIR